MRGVIHANPSIGWQTKYSQALKQGLDSFGIHTEITNDKLRQGEVTVILGPHWCKDFHQERYLYLDRAYWGDPEHVSIHWMEYGEKIYDWQPNVYRPHPHPKPLKTGRKPILLHDYGVRFKVADMDERFHPSEMKSCSALERQLDTYDVAYGGRSTAMVDAAMAGLKVVSLIDNSPIQPLSCDNNANREEWANCLAWHNWSYDEIKLGLPWEHFLK